jgi:ABC-2 type transport system permease protein
MTSTRGTSQDRSGWFGRLTTAAEVVLISTRTQWEDMRSSPFVVLLGVVQPAVLVLVSLLPQVNPSADEGTRVAVGVLLTSFWASTIWTSAGILRRERFQGTLARALTGVRDPRLIVWGKSFGASLLSAGTVAATVTVTFVALRQPVHLGRPFALVVGLVVLLVSGMALGMLLGGIFVYSRYGPQLSSATMYPVFLFGGMLVPLDLLPPFAGWASAAISLRWLQEYLTSVTADTGGSRGLVAAVVVTVGYGLAGSALFQRIVDHARRKGDLDLF